MCSKIIHYSIDDTILVFKQLTEQQPNSIFELDMFAFLKKLHDKYGIVVSCYCFFKTGDFTLTACTRSYKGEFEANSSWLRFGFHGYSGNEDYLRQDIVVSSAQYEQVMYSLMEIVGESSIDRFPRIHTFQASKNFIFWMNSYKHIPVVGLLTADDSRLSYSLNRQQCRQLNTIGTLEYEGIRFLRTTQRFDSLRPKKIKRLFVNMGGQEILFTHEWVFFPMTFKLRIKAVIIKTIMFKIASFYTKRNYTPSFPMDKI